MIVASIVWLEVIRLHFVEIILNAGDAMVVSTSLVAAKFLHEEFTVDLCVVMTRLRIGVEGGQETVTSFNDGGVGKTIKKRQNLKLPAMIKALFGTEESLLADGRVEKEIVLLLH